MATVAKAIHDHILRYEAGLAAAPTSLGGESSISSTDSALPSNVAPEMENGVSQEIFRFLNKNRRSAAADFLNSIIPRPSSTMAPIADTAPAKKHRHLLRYIRANRYAERAQLRRKSHKYHTAVRTGQYLNSTPLYIAEASAVCTYDFRMVQTQRHLVECLRIVAIIRRTNHRRLPGRKREIIFTVIPADLESQPAMIIHGPTGINQIISRLSARR